MCIKGGCLDIEWWVIWDWFVCGSKEFILIEMNLLFEEIVFLIRFILLISGIVSWVI